MEPVMEGAIVGNPPKMTRAEIMAKARAARGSHDDTPYTEPVDDGASRELMDFRHVYLNPKKYDKTYAQKQLRKFQERKPEQFNSQKAQMEKEYAASKSDRPSSDSEVDERGELCVELLRGLLKGMGGVDSPSS